MMTSNKSTFCADHRKNAYIHSANSQKSLEGWRWLQRASEVRGDLFRNIMVCVISLEDRGGVGQLLHLNIMIFVTIKYNHNM